MTPDDIKRSTSVDCKDEPAYVEGQSQALMTSPVYLKSQRKTVDLRKAETFTDERIGELSANIRQDYTEATNNQRYQSSYNKGMNINISKTGVSIVGSQSGYDYNNITQVSSNSGLS